MQDEVSTFPSRRALLRTTALLAGAAATSTLSPRQAKAADYPERPIKIIVPFAPAGPTDIMARILATHLGEALSGTVVVENNRITAVGPSSSVRVPAGARRVDASGKLTLIGIGDSVGEALRRSYPFYTVEKIPANTYPGLEHDVTSAGVMAILVARSSAPDELVYSLTKAVFDNLPQFQSSHPAARHLTLHTALSGMALPLHPGAERYFQQNGIAR